MSRTIPDNRLSDDRGLRMRMRGEERRISSQHRQLDDLFARVLGSVRAGGPRKAVGDFLLFQTALEAHMSVEEEIYFPALHGLRNDVGVELAELVSEHEVIRSFLPRVRRELDANDGEPALRALGELADRVNRHEDQEETLLARITEGPVSGFGGTALDGGD